MESEKYSATPRNIRTNRHNPHIILWQRLNDTSGGHIVCAVIIPKILESVLKFHFFISEVYRESEWISLSISPFSVYSVLRHLCCEL